MQIQVDVRRVQGVLLEIAKNVARILEKHEIPYMLAMGTLLGAVRHAGFIPWDDDFDFFLFEESYERALDALFSELPKSMFLECERTEPKYFHSWAHVKDVFSECTCDLYPHDYFYAHKGISVDLYKLSRIRFCDYEKFRLSEALKYIERRRASGLISQEDFLKREQKYRAQFSQKNKELREENSAQQKSCKNAEREVLVFQTAYDIKSILEMEDVFPLKKTNFEDAKFFIPNKAEKILAHIYGDYMTLPSKEKRVPHHNAVKFFEVEGGGI